MKRLACFISPHGFGHATRTIAVVESLRQRAPSLEVELFTTVPEPLFGESLDHFTYHQIETDIGLIQHDGLHENIAATIDRLDQFLPFTDPLLDGLASLVAGCDGLLCDIAPLGIAVAKRADVPSILLENFTWDWIYQPYLARNPGLQAHCRLFAQLFAQADYHIQTEPVCRPADADLHCPPIFRQSQTDPDHIRHALQIGARFLVVLSLGGIGLDLPFIHRLAAARDCFFVVAGQPASQRMADNLLLLARDSGFHHPDLLGAADLVLCKAGYSTIAECCQAGTRVACIARKQFPESPIITQFVQQRLGGTLLDQDTFLSGDWLDTLPTLLAAPPPPPAAENGADMVASFLLSRI